MAENNKKTNEGPSSRTRSRITQGKRKGKEQKEKKTIEMVQEEERKTTNRLKNKQIVTPQQKMDWRAKD